MDPSLSDSSSPSSRRNGSSTTQVKSTHSVEEDSEEPSSGSYGRASGGSDVREESGACAEGAARTGASGGPGPGSGAGSRSGSGADADADADADAGADSNADGADGGGSRNASHAAGGLECETSSSRPSEASSQGSPSFFQKVGGLFNRRRHSSVKRYHPETWQDDEHAVQCFNCNREFGLLVRRHHCRNCGLCFCDDCTQNRIALPHKQYFDTVRVCDRCNFVLRKVTPLRRSASTGGGAVAGGRKAMSVDLGRGGRAGSGLDAPALQRARTEETNQTAQLKDHVRAMEDVSRALMEENRELRGLVENLEELKEKQGVALKRAITQDHVNRRELGEVRKAKSKLEAQVQQAREKIIALQQQQELMDQTPFGRPAMHASVHLLHQQQQQLLMYGGGRRDAANGQSAPSKLDLLQMVEALKAQTREMYLQAEQERTEMIRDAMALRQHVAAMEEYASCLERALPSDAELPERPVLLINDLGIQESRRRSSSVQQPTIDLGSVDVSGAACHSAADERQPAPSTSSASSPPPPTPQRLPASSPAAGATGESGQSTKSPRATDVAGTLPYDDASYDASNQVGGGRGGVMGAGAIQPGDDYYPYGDPLYSDIDVLGSSPITASTNPFQNPFSPDRSPPSSQNEPVSDEAIFGLEMQQ